VSILAARQLGKNYRKRQVVRDVSLEVGSGEIVGLLGPNGAGKTTSFYMIAGLVRPSQGSVFLDSRDLTAMPVDERARMGLGYLPQEPSVFRKLSVAENILAVMQARGELSEAQQQRRLQILLHELHIEHLADEQGMTLSGGERRRVEIARTLAVAPKFILLDEPFAGVDPISVLDIQRIIRQLAGADIGILVTDHNVRETLGICDRAYIVNEGEIIAAGTPDQVLQDSHVREVYLGRQFSL